MLNGMASTAATPAWVNLPPGTLLGVDLRDGIGVDRGSAVGESLLVLILMVPAFFRMLAPSSTEIGMSAEILGVYIPWVDFLYIPILFVCLLRLSHLKSLGLWAAAAGIWSVVSGLTAANELSAGMLMAIHDTYLPFFLVPACQLNRVRAKILVVPLLLVLGYMFTQILLYSFGLMSYETVIGRSLIWDGPMRIRTTMGPPTGTAMLLVLIWATLWSLTGQRQRWIRWVSSTLFLSSVALLFTRGAILVVLLAAVIYVVRNFAQYASVLRRLTHPKVIIAVLVLPLSLYAIYRTFGGASQLVSRVLAVQMVWQYRLMAGGLDSGLPQDGRLERWRQYRARYGDAYVTGHGANTLDQRQRHLNSGEGVSLADYCHNAYLTVLYESGVPGLLIFLGMLYRWCHRSWSRLQGFGGCLLLAYLIVGMNLESCVLSVEFTTMTAILMCVLGSGRRTQLAVVCGFDSGSPLAAMRTGGPAPGGDGCVAGPMPAAREVHR